MNANEQNTPRLRVGCGQLAGVVFGLWVLYYIVFPSQNPVNRQTVRSAPVAPRFSPTPKPSSRWTYEDLRNIRAESTDAQWEVFADSIVGQRVEWEGWVHEAKADGRLLIDMDAPSESMSIQDVYFDVPASKVLSFNKDEPIEFLGDIESVIDILGSVQVNLENVTVYD
ncbi:MAG: hypothetical protein ACYC4R_16115 [Anaerolineae bacterium]